MRKITIDILSLIMRENNVWYFRSFLFLIVLVSANLMIYAESLAKKKYPGEKTYMYRVVLTDKSATPFSLDKPLAFLSQKSVERRLRQNIVLDSTDLPVNPLYEKKVELCGGKIVSKSKWNNSVVVMTGDTTVVDRIGILPFVKCIRKVWTSPDSVKIYKQRPKYHKELVLRDTADVSYHGAAEEQLKMLGGIKLHDNGYKGRGIVIAVLDAGFLNVDLIPAFRNINIVGYADFVALSKKSIFEISDHGTQVLSTMAISVPKVYVGAAPEASYWLLRCEDQQTEQPVEEDYWAAAAEFADSVGVDVISSSLGFHEYDDPSDNYAYRQQDGQTALISHTASMLAKKGIVLVNSCGNEGMGMWKKICFPADAKNILSVGAVTSFRRNAAFSSLGPTADGRIKPDVMAQGSPTMVVTERGTISSDVGTSFAAPLIAGMVACIWQRNPEKTAFEIIDMVKRLGDNYAHPDNVYGYGIPDFSKNTYNK